jgi:hypothetical protein
MKASLFKVLKIFLNKLWWMSIIMLFPSYLIINQFYLVITKNILLSINYDYPIFFDFFFFVLDTVTLFIHEAGHTIFSIIGWDFLTIFGGTLLQLVIPFFILVSTKKNNQNKLAQCSYFWLGYSWMDSAAYCADAMYRDLPLIGDLPKSSHDFYNLLTMTGILEYYKLIAWIFYLMGVLNLILGIIYPFLVKDSNSNKNNFIDPFISNSKA